MPIFIWQPTAIYGLDRRIEGNAGALARTTKRNSRQPTRRSGEGCGFEQGLGSRDTLPSSIWYFQTLKKPSTLSKLSNWPAGL